MSVLAIPEGLEPLAVWDVRDPDDPIWGLVSTVDQALIMLDAVNWSKTCIPDSGRTFRVEFCLLDAPFAVVHRYAVNDRGHKFAIEPGGPAVTEEPVIVPLAELPPEHLLR